MVPVLDFYATPGLLTSPGRYAASLAELPRELGELTETIANLGIYDAVASRFYGIEVPESRAQEIHCRAVDDMLAGLAALDGELATPRTPERRLFSRCGGFTRLLVAALRAQGVPARSRCGFAAYFNTGQFEDHWVGEVWDATQQRWRLVDAQLDETWRRHIGGADNMLDLARDRFLVAADAWRRCRAGETDPARFGITFGGLHGLWFVAGSLVRDLAALNKVEMHPWDVWGVQPAPDEPLGAERLAFFDELAELTRDPDASFDELLRRYESDDRLRVPATVYNAVRERDEAV